MIINVSNIVGPDAAKALAGFNLHKVAAAETGVSDLNLKSAVEHLFTQVFYKNAMWRAIAEGITALSNIENGGNE